MVSVVVGDIGEKSVKLNKKYVIGTHVMWFEIEMYADFIDGMVNLLETVENKENVTIDLSGIYTSFYSKSTAARRRVHFGVSNMKEAAAVI